jgi:glycosyltransferase involved in cell wall biosynthesis
MTLGIGICTYNRKESLVRTLEAVRRHTNSDHELVVADDGSTDDTVAAVTQLGVRCIAGQNRGVCWNKNRLLFYLNNVRHCDPIILLEDDAYPIADRWEYDWVAAALRWGHVNYAGPWFAESSIMGSGTPDDPYESYNVSGQCAAFSRDAVNFVGFLDRRFGKFSNSHVEHSWRMARAGYGGLEVFNDDSSFRGMHYYLINSKLTVIPETSNFPFDEKIHAELDHLFICHRDESIHRWAWRTDEELQQFRREMRDVSIPQQL